MSRALVIWLAYQWSFWGFRGSRETLDLGNSGPSNRKFLNMYEVRRRTSVPASRRQPSFAYGDRLAATNSVHAVGVLRLLGQTIKKKGKGVAEGVLPIRWCAYLRADPADFTIIRPCSQFPTSQRPDRWPESPPVRSPKLREDEQALYSLLTRRLALHRTKRPGLGQNRDCGCGATESRVDNVGNMTKGHSLKHDNRSPLKPWQGTRLPTEACASSSRAKGKLASGG